MEKNDKKNKPEAAPNDSRPTVLVVEDDVGLNHLIRRTLERDGLKTHQALTGAEAIAAAVELHDSVILLDYLLPDMTGKQIIMALREKRIEMPLIIMTGHGDERIAVEVMKLGARDYVIKEPDFYERIPKIIRQTFEAIAAEKKLARMEAALQESEEKFRILFEQAADIILLMEITPEGMPVIREANSATFRLLGYERDELIGKPVTFVDAAPDVTKVVQVRRQNILSGTGTVFESKHRCKNGTILNFECSVSEMQVGSKTFAISVERDITERKRLEKEKEHLQAQLNQSQKLEAIGQLSSGVAHDFNNLLGGIMGNAELLKKNLNPDSPLLRHSEVIISSCMKAADLTRQLLTFARKAPIELQIVDLNDVVKQAVGLIERTIDRRVEIAVNLQEQPVFISGDRNQLENALLNIAINSRDAMPDGGCLSIWVETADMDQVEMLEGHSEAIKGPYVKISMADTGTGMSKEIKDRIFEPFFTTKEVGKGTGLGLASVYGCVKQHDGYIAVESKVGIGTRFDLYFPIAEPGPSAGQKQETALTPGKGSLLVVDDEAVFHMILTDIFEPLGYTLHCCSNGIEAEEYYRVNKSAIDVVILDLNMPKMSGAQCYKRLKEINPGVRVIIASGYGDISEREALQKEGVEMFVQKPYKAAELNAKIKELVANAP